MTEKERFVTLAQTGRFTISDLCTDFGISRKTGHKYLQRYESQGRAGLGPKKGPMFHAFFVQFFQLPPYLFEAA